MPRFLLEAVVQKRIFVCLLLCMLVFSSACAEDLPAILQEGGVLCLVNREVNLSGSYEPADLVKPRVDTRKESLQERIYMRAEAADALEQLFAAAMREAAYKLLAVSGYRSYGTQQVLFNQKANAVGRAAASLTVARAGQSEHQLGLAMDVQCPDTPTLSEDFAETPEGQWVSENAHRFGFIIRYKAEWQPFTGYSYEPWHLRYIGISHATAVHMLNIPYETYYEQLCRLPEYVLLQGNPYLLAGAVNDLIAGDDSILSLLPADAADPTAALEAASARYLPAEITYQQAVYQGFPTPRPSPAPRVDTDTEESSYLSLEENR